MRCFFCTIFLILLLIMRYISFVILVLCLIMKKLFFGIFNLSSVLFFLIFCISGSCQFGRHWNFFVYAYKSGDISLAIKETLLISLFAFFLIAALGLLISAVIYLFCLFKERDNPWRCLFYAGKKAFAFIWNGTFWNRMWLYMQA